MTQIPETITSNTYLKFKKGKKGDILYQHKWFEDKPKWVVITGKERCQVFENYENAVIFAEIIKITRKKEKEKC